VYGSTAYLTGWVMQGGKDVYAAGVSTSNGFTTDSMSWDGGGFNDAGMSISVSAGVVRIGGATSTGFALPDMLSWQRPLPLSMAGPPRPPVVERFSAGGHGAQFGFAVTRSFLAGTIETSEPRQSVSFGWRGSLASWLGSTDGVVLRN
jgi:hypothetical protein